MTAGGVFWLVVLLAVVAGIIYWADQRSTRVSPPPPPPQARRRPVVVPPKPTADALFEVKGRRRPDAPLVVQARAGRQRGRSAAEQPGAGATRRRSRITAPCWICGGPRKLDCQHCHQKGPGT